MLTGYEPSSKVENVPAGPQDWPSIAAALSALAEVTMEFMAREPDLAELYRTAGFEMLWAGITRR